MVRWGMVIDLKRCIGCWSCAIACAVENGLPRGFFRTTIVIREMGERKVIMPVQCNHCRNPSCVCPENATIKRDDGIVYIDWSKCRGCKYCLSTCPYGVRNYIDALKTWFPGYITPYEKIKRAESQLREGVVDKCDFCMKRIDDGLKKGLKPGIDRDATPACVNCCPTKARYFGDLDDPTSEVSRLIKDRHGKQIDLARNDPSIFYLE